MNPRIRSVVCLTPAHPAAEAVVVIPTYEEAENIPTLFAALATCAAPPDVCIVDDGSADGTAAAVRAAAATYPARTFLLERTGKHGLGTAYRDGFRWVLANIPTANVIVQMDADLSHDPAAIPALVASARTVGACIGSRYVPGGSMPDWKTSRRWLSKCANLYATLVLRLRTPTYRIKDSTAGFVAWRRDVLAPLMQQQIPGEGYGFQLSLKWHACQNGTLFHEHPITFRDRRVGQSKLSKRIVAEGLQIPWKLAGMRGMAALGWWVGIPLLVALLTVVPFWLIRCAGDAVLPSCLRVWSVAEIIFDLFTYLDRMGRAFTGEPGITIGVNAWIIQGMHQLLPSLTVTELWLFLRWGYGVASWWLFAWLLRVWGIGSRTAQRVAASVLWVWLFWALGFRPSTYSWVIPFLVVAIAGCVAAARALQARKWGAAVVWGAIALLCGTVYPWLLVFIAMWEITLFVLIAWPHQIRLTAVAGAWVAACSVAIAAASVLARVLLQPWGMSELETLARNGGAFTHIPPLAIPLIVAFLGVALGVIALRAQAVDERRSEWGWILAAWIAVCTGWLSTIAVGLYFQNDHFRLMILFLAWLTACMAWHARIHAKDRLALITIVLIAAAGFLYGLRAPYGLNHDLLNVQHVFLWACLLATAGWLLRPPERRPSPRVTAMSVLAFAAIMGSLAVIPLFQKDAAAYPWRQAMEPAIQWIQAYVPEGERVCTTPPFSYELGAFAARPTFLTEHDLYTSQTDAALYARMAMLASVVNVAHPPTRKAWEALFWSRQLSCGTAPLERLLMRPFAPSDAAWEAWVGCPTAAIQRDKDAIAQMAAQTEPHPNIAALCPWIVVPKTEEGTGWRLPEGAMSQYEDSALQIYRLSSE